MKDFLEIRYELTQDGTMVEEGSLTDVSAAPHQDTETELVLNIPETGRVYLKLKYYLKKKCLFCNRGMNWVLRSGNSTIKMTETKPQYNICKAAKCLLQTKFV